MFGSVVVILFLLKKYKVSMREEECSVVSNVGDFPDAMKLCELITTSEHFTSIPKWVTMAHAESHTARSA